MKYYKFNPDIKDELEFNDGIAYYIDKNGEERFVIDKSWCDTHKFSVKEMIAKERRRRNELAMLGANNTYHRTPTNYEKIAKMIAEGKSNKEIAAELGITSQYVSNVKRKIRDLLK